MELTQVESSPVNGNYNRGGCLNTCQKLHFSQLPNQHGTTWTVTSTAQWGDCFWECTLNACWDATNYVSGGRPQMDRIEEEKKSLSCNGLIERSSIYSDYTCCIGEFLLISDQLIADLIFSLSNICTILQTWISGNTSCRIRLVIAYLITLCVILSAMPKID